MRKARVIHASPVRVSRTDMFCFLCPIPFFDFLFFKLLLRMLHRVRVRWLLLREQLLSNCKRVSMDTCVFSCIFSPLVWHGSEWCHGWRFLWARWHRVDSGYHCFASGGILMG
ncbi:uncharacterized protein K441DRAFT_182123 [Cenococcum geophilum 1.58]|uniref:uncharacterized protein n=1 Tax=Cenococcum geophilum 1.58 TaxID=794803 RepID=UPI00358FF315|nr:hypothetical protein K441DRAFT_182123 [Cenococcum geophilum 1.58]